MLMKYGVWFSLFLVITLFSCGKQPEGAGEGLRSLRPTNQLLEQHYLENGAEFWAADEEDAAAKAKLLRLLAAQKLVGTQQLAKYTLLAAQVRVSAADAARWEAFSFIDPETFLKRLTSQVRLMPATESVLGIKSGVAFAGEDVFDPRIYYLVKLFDIYQNNYYEYLSCKNLWYNEAKDRWADDHLEVLLAQNQHDDEIYEVLLMEAYQENDPPSWFYSLYPREMLESFLNAEKTAFRREIKVDYRYANGLFEVLDPANHGKAVHLYAHKISRAWWEQQHLHPQPLRHRPGLHADP